MKLSRLLLLLLSISLVILSCREDEIGFIPNDDDTEIMSTVDIEGFIIDPDGNAVPDASVQYNFDIVETNANGYYIIENVEVSSQHAFLEVSKPGFFDGSRTFRTQNTGTVFHRTTLVPLGDALSFTGGSGSVENNLVSITFPENSVIDEVTREVYTGNVEVYVRHIGTDEFAMPGDLTAINENDELEILDSYGMVFIEMFSEGGNKLNVADGMSVPLTYEIPSELVSSAPDSIAMWWYDYDAGAWREDGVANRDGNRWVGQVSHFSCWNFDVNAPSVLVNGQIITSTGGLSQFYITVLNNSGKGGRGSAKTDGSFSGRVEAGVPLELTIRFQEPNCADVVYQESIGPFDQDVDLGVITIDTDDFSSKPQARFLVNRVNNQDLTFSFTNTSSVSGLSNTAFTSTWDFGGDGASSEESPVHTFSAEGFYDITLTITAADGEVDVATQTIQVGSDLNKYARVTDNRDDDTGELRLSIDSIQTGRLTFIYRVREGSEMNIEDAFISVAGNSTTGDAALTEVRLKDDTNHEFREGASDATIAAANFPEGMPDVWTPIEISWTGNGVSAPLYSVTIGGQTVITDAISTTNGGPGDIDLHLDNLENGVKNFQWKYNSQSATSDGVYHVDNIIVYSSDSGTETIMFQDDFEGRITGENLNPEYNPNSPYHQNSNDATVGEFN